MDGTFDVIPRGIISLSSSAIKSSDITNRFVMGEFQRKEGDQLKSYVSFLYSLPLQMDFQVEIYVDTWINLFKIEQSIREQFYKNKSYFVTFKGMKIRCRCGIPETMQYTKPTNYKVGTK